MAGKSRTVNHLAKNTLISRTPPGQPRTVQRARLKPFKTCETRKLNADHKAGTTAGSCVKPFGAGVQALWI
jgi:hypothetical protein